MAAAFEADARAVLALGGARFAAGPVPEDDDDEDWGAWSWRAWPFVYGGGFLARRMPGGEEAHVALSPAFGAPVLLVVDALEPSDDGASFSLARRRETRRDAQEDGVLDWAMHPVLNVPCRALHVCGVRETLEALAPGEAPGLALLAWLALVGTRVPELALAPRAYAEARARLLASGTPQTTTTGSA